MNKPLLLSFLLLMGFVSCKNTETKIDKLEIATNYYAALDSSDATAIAHLLTDSLVTKETQYDYKQTFSQKEYMEWVQWDGIFDPTYEVLYIEQEGDLVKARISKMDKRIAFLHQEPIVTNQTIRFENDKISSVETTAYVFFNDATFVKNRDALLSWIAVNHPEMNEFINNQTTVGGKNYLKAIELYKNKE